MLLLQTFTARYFKLMILNGDKICHFAFVQYEKTKTQQELISHQLKFPHSGKFMQFYDSVYLYNFIKKTFWAADFLSYHTV